MTTPRPPGTSGDPPGGCGPAWGGPALGPLSRGQQPLACEERGGVLALADQPGLHAAHQHLRRARSHGAATRCGGATVHVGSGGAYYQPTLVERVDASNPAVREEIFGPVLTVQVFDSEEEGLALAAHEHYGLAAGVHTADLGRALRAMRAIQAGTVWINRYGRSADFVIPTGGYHQSGIGKDLGRQAVEANLRVKSVLIDFAAPQ